MHATCGNFQHLLFFECFRWLALLLKLLDSIHIGKRTQAACREFSTDKGDQVVAAAR